MKPLYLISSSCISPQQTFGEADFFNAEPLSTQNNVLYCIEPDFRKFINPVQIRRMSRALKIGYSAAIDCIQHAKDPGTIDAIMIGTGKGCLVDTEEFLHSIQQYHETALNPTHFIHSTYNQLNGSIALSQKINSYNVTYVHRGFSFEHTLLDASLLVEEGNATTVLVGSFDEMTSEHFMIKKHWGYWKEEFIDSALLLSSETPGTIAGEGSSFYILSAEKPVHPAVSIRAVATLYKPVWEDIKDQLQKLLKENDLQPGDIDLVMLGNNGDAAQNNHTTQFNDFFSAAGNIYFKHLCGEYDTAVQFGLWVSNQVLLQQHVPDFLCPLDGRKPIEGKEIKNILIYNNYFELNQSLILLNFS